MGTVRKPALLLGGPNSGTPPTADQELAIDTDAPAKEVDSVDGTAEAFALSQSHSRGEDDQRAIAVEEFWPVHEEW